MRDCEDRHVLDVRIVLRCVCDNVVHIMASLPPAEAEATDEVRNDDANNGVDDKVVSDAHVAGVVGGEDQLMPEKTKEDCAERIPPFPQKVDE